MFVDEAGDRGWGGRASPVFVASAAIVRDRELAALHGSLDRICSDLGKPPTTGLHWAENVRQHAQRKRVARVLGTCPATLSNVVVMKHAMVGAGTALSDATMQHNYAVRRLLERVSWFVDEQAGEAIVPFAHVRRFPYWRLTSYLEYLRVQSTEIRWRAFPGKARVNQPNQVRGLQVADLVAGAVYSATNPDAYADYEEVYLNALAPRVYVRARGAVQSYGMNIVALSGFNPATTWRWCEPDRL